MAKYTMFSWIVDSSFRKVKKFGFEYLNPWWCLFSFWRDSASPLLCSFASSVTSSTHVLVFPGLCALELGTQPRGARLEISNFLPPCIFSDQIHIK